MSGVGIPQERIDRARAVRLEDEIARRGITLRRQGKELVGPCPICGGTDRFSINTAKQVWNCRGCGNGGDIIAFAQHFDRCEFGEAVNILAGEPQHTNGAKVNGAKPNGSTRPTAKRELEEAYDYVDAHGELKYQSVRFHFRNPDGTLVLGKAGKPDKTFGQRRPADEPEVWIWLMTGECMRRRPGDHWYRFDDEKWAAFPATRQRKTLRALKPLPYRLPQLNEAIASEQTVFVVEGEQKADALAKWKLAATCNAEGAGKWTAAHAACLRGADVMILPDNDDTGRKHAEAIAQSLQGIAARVRMLELPGLAPKEDIVDWQRAGHTREEIDALVEQAREWKPTGDRSHQETPGGRGLLVHRASAINIERIEWLWPGRIAIGKQALIAGEAGLGKSQASIAMGATVTTAGAWPCEEGRAPLGSVIFLCAEDGAADTIVPRLMAAGADLDRVHIVSAVHADGGNGLRAFNLQADLDPLEQKIREIGDVRLVVIDPISSYLGPKLDSHVNAEVRSVLEPVGEMASRLRIAVVSITHPPKGTGTTAINRFIGSIAFVAAARSAFMVTRDAEDDERRLLLPVKNNLAALGHGFAFRLEQRIVDKDIVASCVAWETSHVTTSADQALRAADDNSQAGARDTAKQFLAEILAAGPLPKRDITEAADANCIAKRTLERAKADLGVIAKKDGFDSGWTWQLPDQKPQWQDEQ